MDLIQYDSLIIPGLKDNLALHCLARVPREDYPSLRRVSRLWQSILLGRTLYNLRKQIGLGEPWIFVSFTHKNTSSWIQSYDPKRDKWHYISHIPGVNRGEILKGFALVSVEERLYVIGGRICSASTDEELCISKEVQVFNIITGKWSRLASMCSPRVDFACTSYNGLIYVAGGRTDTWNKRGVRAAEAYIPYNNTWISLPDMHIDRYKCVGVTQGTKIFIIGGFACNQDEHNSYVLDRSSVEVYDPYTNKWEIIRTMWQLDVPPNQIIPVNGVLYSSGDCLSAWKGRVEVYDGTLNVWKIAEGSVRMQPVSGCENGVWDVRKWKQCYLTMGLVGKSSLYFIGGYAKVAEHELGLAGCSNGNGYGNEFLEVVSVFETESGKWTSMEHMSSTHKDICSHCCIVTL